MKNCIDKDKNFLKVSDDDLKTNSMQQYLKKKLIYLEPYNKYETYFKEKLIDKIGEKEGDINFIYHSQFHTKRTLMVIGYTAHVLKGNSILTEEGFFEYLIDNHLNFIVDKIKNGDWKDLTFKKGSKIDFYSNKIISKVNPANDIVSRHLKIWIEFTKK